jgi:hypothetical protein
LARKWSTWLRGAFSKEAGGKGPINVSKAMKRWRPAIAVLCGLVAGGCVAQTTTPKPPARTEASAPKRSLPKLECTFDVGGGTKIYRTYLIAPTHLVEQDPVRQRFRITSDDGETIDAEHLDRGSKSPTTVQIRLREHDATLMQPNADGTEGQRLSGICAQTN